ncbi:hypothetical protein M427DRAFT_50952 [Gonapodya prolifera JEL478]|uniref:Uncharacterized protein n=1 Tax=Gonapodya prolifera (strain JEL478) TaxID=1344416 RepID=A0A139AXP4_GONPJ|nr:hypothetical protein M427DRAFT_50952 [Gonapodya prolifera JEL478]|eukprot:KXS21521.1 hypothetical protein M427DRAFT_50952 [Gonapodya prolifera JEL478]
MAPRPTSIPENPPATNVSVTPLNVSHEHHLFNLSLTAEEKAAAAKGFGLGLLELVILVHILALCYWIYRCFRAPTVVGDTKRKSSTTDITDSYDLFQARRSRYRFKR